MLKSTKSSQEYFDLGLQVREEMFGSKWAKDAVDNATDLTRDFQDIMNRYCFGETWNRPQLNRRDRSMITLAMLCALGKQDEITLHVKGAKKNGMTDEEIREVFLHAMIYCGVPACVTGLRGAGKAYAELDTEKDT